MPVVLTLGPHELDRLTEPRFLTSAARKDKVPEEVGAFTARDDQRSLHPLNGLVYVALLFGTGQWRRILPTSWDVFGPTTRCNRSCTSWWSSCSLH